MQTRSSPSIQTLYRLAAQASVPDYERTSKAALFEKLKEQFNIDRLQRAEARHSLKRAYRENETEICEGAALIRPTKKMKLPTARSKKSVRLNKLDPIMMGPLKKETFNFFRPNGSYVAFNVDSLVRYILATGDFSDPETRIPFSDEDLDRIDRLARDEGLGFSSVLKARHDPHAFNDLKFRRDALLGLERCAGEIVTDILVVVETCDPDEAQMRLLLREFPAFSDLYRQMSDADFEYAQNSMRHWKLYLKGPPNNPNEDDFGLLQFTLQFMDTLVSSSSGSRQSGGSSGYLDMFNIGLNAMGFTLGMSGNGNHTIEVHHGDVATYSSTSSTSSSSTSSSSTSSSSTSSASLPTIPNTIASSSSLLQ